jgi:excisionase family DNA binding protein
MPRKLISIRSAASLLGVSIGTLRRWDENGLLKSIRTGERGHRYYREEDLALYLTDLFGLAKQWVCSEHAEEPTSKFYCRTLSDFNARLGRLVFELTKYKQYTAILPLLGLIAGEIGENSFAHNIGNWPDIPGAFFGYDLKKREIVLADRGLGILQTLQRVRPDLNDDKEALSMAFTEFVSGRAPEKRGKGLKLVKQVIEESGSLSLLFQTGYACLEIYPQNKKFHIVDSSSQCRGCLVLVRF